MARKDTDLTDVEIERICNLPPEWEMTRMAAEIRRRRAGLARLMAAVVRVPRAK